MKRQELIEIIKRDQRLLDAAAFEGIDLDGPLVNAEDLQHLLESYAA